jgi:hypothetical protein
MEPFRAFYTNPLLFAFVKRELSAQDHTDMEEYDGNKYEFGFANKFWNAVESLIEPSSVDLSDRDFSEDQQVLRLLNEALYTAITSNTDAKLYLPDNDLPVILSVEEYDGGINLTIGGETRFFPDISKKTLQCKLESQTTSHIFSRAIKGPFSLDRLFSDRNYPKLIQTLSEYRTVTGVPVKSQQETVDGQNGKWVVPSLEKQIIPGAVGAVVHIGSNYIAGINKIEEVDDAVTAAYIGDMLFTTVVDGYGASAKPECSRVHSSLISAAAAYAVQDLRSGKCRPDQLRSQFHQYIREFYELGLMPDGDTGVTFAGGCMYPEFDKDSETYKFKLFSYGLSAGMFVAVDRKGNIIPYHAQETGLNGKPYVKAVLIAHERGSYNTGGHLENLGTGQLHDVDDSVIEIKGGSDGCFARHCKEIPLGFDNAPDMINVTVENLPKHGATDPGLTDVKALRAAYQQHKDKLEKAQGYLQITEKRIQMVKRPSDVFNMPDINEVTNTIEQLDALKKCIETRDWLILEDGAKGQLQDLFDITEKGDNVRTFTTKEEFKNDERVDALLGLLNLNPGVFNGESYVMGVSREINNEFQARMNSWKTIIGEPENQDSEWRTLATREGQQKHADKFVPPSKEKIVELKEDQKKAKAQCDYLQVNLKRLAGDDIVFVSLHIPEVKDELTRRTLAYLQKK